MPSYVIISPVRNEERYIEKTLRSIARQSLKPIKWLIVDDGSTDRTMDIATVFARRHRFMECIKRPQRADEGSSIDRIAKAAPPRTFNYGLAYLADANIDFDYIVKLDGDLSFAPDYFARLIDEFEGDSSLGIASGLASFPRGNDFWTPYIPTEHVLGCSKVYRRKCFEEIGGLVEVLGWDTIDEIKAQMYGWHTQHFKDVPLIHWRLMGTRTGYARGKMRHGFTNYYLGYHPLYMLARIARRIAEWPYGISSALLAAGYIRGWLTRAERFPDDKFRAYLRETQMRQIRRMLRRAA